MVYRNISKRISSVAVKASLKVAWRSETDCGDNQLEETSLTDFLLGRSQVFIQDEYLGPSWTALLRRDVTRFVANEELSDFDPASLFKISSTFSSVVTESPASSSSSATLPKMAFFDAARLHMYPAVQEVVKALHSLPAEINSMRDSSYNSYNFLKIIINASIIFPAAYKIIKQELLQASSFTTALIYVSRNPPTNKYNSFLILTHQ